MSQEIREKALSAGVATVAVTGDYVAVIAAAKAFEAFLLGGAAPKETALVKAERAQPVAAKSVEKAQPVKAATKVEPKAEKAKAADPDAKKLVGDKVNELLKANKRDEAVALLASFDGAASATGIVVQGDEVIQAFLTQADEILSSSEAGLTD